MKSDNPFEYIIKTLIEHIDERILLSEKKYFKEEVKIRGVRVSTVTRLSKQFYELLIHKSKAEIFELCEQLWNTGYSEDAYVACNLSYYIHERYSPEDFKVFERWVETYVTNWATCDILCNHSIGTFIEMYPEFIEELKQWAFSSNRWLRRGAAVTLIIPARKGLYKEDIFEIANILLMDKEDLVQKGYGWLLKATSEAHLQEVYDYVISKKAVMPRTAYRYALEKMPEEVRREAMKKKT